MKMYLKQILLCGAVAMTASLVSCSVEQEQISPEESYSREFVKLFGTVDGNQDWSVVEQKSLAFDVATPTHVKIYELQAGEYRLAADYENVTSGQTITFDGMKGDDTFLVSLNDRFVSATNGQTVSMKNTASMLRSSVIPDGCAYAKQQSDYTTIPVQTSEESPLTILAKNDGKNYKEVHAPIQRTDAYYTRAQEGHNVTFYPLYWHSTEQHTVGLYFTDFKGGYHEVDIYKDHEGDDVQYYDANSGTWVNAGTGAKSTDLGEGKQWQYTAGINSKGYTITVDAGIIYGIYVKVGGKTYYSQRTLNDDQKSYFAYSMERNVGGTEAMTYLYFDDPTTDDGDFNDLIICTNELLTPVTESSVGWTVACEDLGGTYDFDFNDLVFRVYHTSGYTYLDIVPLAAGGTLNAWLHFADRYGYFNKDIPENCEWHSLFGATANSYSSSQMINTYSIGETTSQTVRLTGIEKDWSMVPFTSSSIEVGGFSIKVKQKDGTITNIVGPNSSTKTPSAPQMLVLPLDWHWPAELVNITKAYPGGNGYPSFSSWAKDVDKNQDWVKYYTSDTQYIEEMVPRTKQPIIIDVDKQ